MGISLADCLLMTLINAAICICLPKMLMLIGSNVKRLSDKASASRLTVTQNLPPIHLPELLN